MEFINSIKKGIGFSLGILIVFGIIFGSVYAAGLHTPPEILSGTFLGDYLFSGNIGYSGDVDFSSANVSGITFGDSIPSGFIGAFYNNSCPTGWSACDGTSGTPDLRGQFLRGINDFGTGTRSDGNQDPAGLRAIGNLQLDRNAAHIHSVNPPSTTSSTIAAHSHAGVVRADMSITLSKGTGSYKEAAGGAPTYGTGSTGSAGGHSHTVNIAAFNSASSGGTDARPNNVAVIYCMKQ